MVLRVFLMLLSLAAASIGAVPPGAPAKYVGGTLQDLPARTEGLVITTGPDLLLFKMKKQNVEIPYEKIDLLEYGQKVDRRYALGVLVSPLLLLSKKRRHYLTLGYSDSEGRRHAMVLQIHKDHVRSVLASLEAKTGRRVEYQDEEARKAGKG